MLFGPNPNYGLGRCVWFVEAESDELNCPWSLNADPMDSREHGSFPDQASNTDLTEVRVWNSVQELIGKLQLSDF